MIVCVCHRGTESQIALHALTGCSTVEVVQDELRLAPAIGACRDRTRSTSKRRALPVAASAGACEHPHGAATQVRRPEHDRPAASVGPPAACAGLTGCQR
jgi:bacterioferritin-associated ferredoxin